MSFISKCFRAIFFLGCCLPCGSVFAQLESTGPRYAGSIQVFDSVVTITPETNGQPREAGSGVVIRSDGLILTAYHLVKDARRIQIKLRNGEIFDTGEPVAYDQRRNIAL